VNESTFLGFFFLGMMLVIVVWSPIVIKLWALMKRYYLDINKIWSISLNGNNSLGTVRLVKPTPDGLKVPKKMGGFEVPTELNFMFKDRVAGNPIAVWDEDTGLLLRPYAGEIEMGDPAVNRSRELGIAVDNMLKNGGVNWAAIAVILGVLALLGIIVVGIMVTNVA
jgi:hypothetical protein